MMIFKGYKRLLLLVIIIGVLLVGGVGCSNGDSDQDLSEDVDEQRVSVEVLEVELGELSDYISVVAETKPIRSVQLTPQVQGEIERIMVGVGDRVEAGDQLVELNKDDINIQIKQGEAALEGAKANLERALKGARVEEISQLEAQLEQAESNYNRAKITYQRQEELFKEAVISKQQLEGAEGQYISARTAYRSAQLSMDILEEGASDEDIRALRAGVSQAQAGLERTKLMLARSQVKSPLGGVVTGVYGEVGEIGGTGPIVSIADIDLIKVMAYVSESNLNNIHAGDEVDISFSSLDRSIVGEIRYVSSVIDQQRGNFPVEIIVDNEDNLIRAGLFGEVRFVNRSYEDSIVIPQNGVLRDGEERYVYLYNDGEALRREVELGLSTGDKVIVKDGLGVGDLLVIRGQEYIDQDYKLAIIGRGGN